MMLRRSDPTQKPVQSATAKKLWHATWMECQRIAVAYNLSLAWEDSPTGRTLMLLGPDSPSDMSRFFPWAAFSDARFEHTSSVVLRWLLDRGEWFTGVELDWLVVRAAVLADC